jgi:hypothetical protein
LAVLVSEIVCACAPAILSFEINRGTDPNH